MQRKKYQTVDEFVKDFDGVTRERLEILRRVIREEVPEEAVEKISYNIPAFLLNGYLVYFAGYVNHVSLYPVPAMVPAAFEKEILRYKKGKGTLQFVHTESLPLDFIRQTVRYLVEQNKARKRT